LIILSPGHRSAWMSAAYDPTLPLGAAITFCVYRLFAKRKNRAPDGPYWGNSPVWGALGTTLLGLVAGGLVCVKDVDPKTFEILSRPCCRILGVRRPGHSRPRCYCRPRGVAWPPIASYVGTASTATCTHPGLWSPNGSAFAAFGACLVQLRGVYAMACFGQHCTCTWSLADAAC